MLTMQLTYHRQAYSNCNNQVQTTASERTARFLGQSYILRRPVQPFKLQLAAQKYRCIVYGA